MARILCLVGAVNVPIIHFSVQMVEDAAPRRHGFSHRRAADAASMLTHVRTMAIAYTILFAGLLLVRMRSEIFARRLRT